MPRARTTTIRTAHPFGGRLLPPARQPAALRRVPVGGLDFVPFSFIRPPACLTKWSTSIPTGATGALAHDSSFSRSRSVGCTAYTPRPRRWSTLSTPSTKYAGYAEHQVRRVRRASCCSGNMTRLSRTRRRSRSSPRLPTRTFGPSVPLGAPLAWLYAARCMPDVACCVLCTAYVVRMSYMRHDACSAVIA